MDKYNERQALFRSDFQHMPTEHHADSSLQERRIIEQDEFKPKRYPEIWDQVQQSPRGFDIYTQDTLNGIIQPGHPVYDMIIPPEIIADETNILSRFHWPEKNSNESLSIAVANDHFLLEFAATPREHPGKNLPGIAEVFEYNASNLPRNGTWAFFVNFEFQMAQMGYPIVTIDNTTALSLLPYFLTRLDYIPVPLLAEKYSNLKEYGATKIRDRFSNMSTSGPALGERLMHFGYMVQWYGQDPQDIVDPAMWSKLQELKQLFNELKTPSQRGGLNGPFYQKFKEFFLNGGQ